VEAITIQDHRYDIFTSSLGNIEFADDAKRAIVIIPLMHVGANKKGLYWTASMLKKVAPMFKGIPFRYDLEGQEGSSHTLNKLSSPHFDVGWTYSSDEGAWYDDKTKIMWVKGEVTHPDVIEKLSRQTSDGKREVNYASMGVIVEEAKCSLCGAPFPTDSCENGHERNKKYDMGICYKVPTEVSKALHAALTNDPADGEAEIKNVLFQEMGYEANSMDKKNQTENKGDSKPNPFEKKDNTTSDSKPNPFEKKGVSSNQEMNTNTTNNEYNASPHENRFQAGSQMQHQELSNQIPGGLATSSPQTARPGIAPSPEDILRDLAERIKTIEQKISVQTGSMQQPGQMPGQQMPGQIPGQTPELVNAAPQDQFTQDNMGTTQQFDQQTEAGKMDVKDAQNSNAKTAVNPEKKEVQDMMGGDPMQQIMQMLQMILQRLPGAETQDMGKEALSVTKSAAKKPQDDIPTEHMGPGDAVANSTDSSNEKNKAGMQKPGSVDTADNLKQEVADLKEQMKSMRSKMEIQDNDMPEFGGSNSTAVKAEVADMGAKGRAEKFGEYGAWDSIFNGAQSATKFKR